MLKRKQWNHAWVGSDIGGYWQQRYRYNGKEMHSNSGLLDYGFRYYRVSAEGRDDPSVGRFMGVDLLAEESPAWSSNSYAFNAPTRFIDPDGRKPQDIIVGGVKWTPGASGSGHSSFVQNTFAALNQMTSISGVGFMQFKDTQGQMYRGHVVLDFVEGGRYSDVTININQVNDGKHGYIGGNISFDDTADLMIGGNPDMAMSPSVLLLHEFGHAWLHAVNPSAKEKLANNFGVAGFNKLNPKYGDSFEHDKILGELENPASEALGQGVRMRYHEARWWYENLPNPIHPFAEKHDIIYRTKNSTTTDEY